MPKSETLRASRRNVLKGVGIATVGASLAPAGVALAQTTTPAAPSAAKGPKLLAMEGKAKLIVLGDKPLNAETPAEMTDDDVTPIDKFFIRNNGLVPDAPANAKAWKIKIDGEVEKPMEITLGDLMSRFPNVSYKMMLEYGGNGRSFFSPEARGNQWTNGGAGCAEWTGVRLADVLKAAGVKPSAVYTGHYGADPHLSGDASKPAISRGVPCAKG